MILTQAKPLSPHHCKHRTTSRAGPAKLARVMASLTTASGSHGPSPRYSSTLDQAQSLQAGPESEQGRAAKHAEYAPAPVALKIVVADAVRRWFDDTLQDARRGDVKQQALVGQMYAEGYGCEQNPKAAKEWTDKAKERGYRMLGVYCEL